MDRPIFFKTLILKGKDGAGVRSVEKTGTSGTVDTYTITFTDGNTATFTVTNGSSIDTIALTDTSGLVDTYTITLTDGSTSTFTVTNGESQTVPTDGVIFYDGAGIPDGYEESNPPVGQGAEIDDTTASLSTTYSSEKIEELVASAGGGGLPVMPWIYANTKVSWEYNPLNYYNHIKGTIENADADKGLVFDLKPYNLESGKSYTFTCDFIGNTVAASSSNYACNFKYSDSSPAVETWNTGNYFQLQTLTASVQHVTLTFTASSDNYIIFNARKFQMGGGYRINSFEISETTA